MTIDQINNIILIGNNKEKYDAYLLLKKPNLSIETFDILFFLLEDNDYQNRLFAIYNLINDYSLELKNINIEKVKIVYSLLFDKHGVIVDRIYWALSIIGDKAMDIMIQQYPFCTDEDKNLIVYALGRGKFSERSADRIKILLTGIKSKNEELKFNSMFQLMANCNRKGVNGWSSIYDLSIDLNQIQNILFNVALEFKNSKNAFKKEKANSFITRYNNKLK